MIQGDFCFEVESWIDRCLIVGVGGQEYTIGNEASRPFFQIGDSRTYFSLPSDTLIIQRIGITITLKYGGLTLATAENGGKLDYINVGKEE